MGEAAGVMAWDTWSSRTGIQYRPIDIAAEHFYKHVCYYPIC